MINKNKWKTVLSAAQEISSSLKLEDILETLIKKIIYVVEAADAGVIFLFDEKEDLLIASKGFGFDMKFLVQVRMTPGESISGKTFESKKSNIFAFRNDTSVGMNNITPSNKELYFKSIKAKKLPESTICVPLQYKDKCFGVITLDSFLKTKTFTNDDLEILETIGYHVATAIDNSRLYTNEQKNLDRIKLLNEKINQKYETQSSIIEIYDYLISIVLEGGSIKDICKAFSSTLGRDVVIYNDFMQELSSNFIFEERTINFNLIKKIQSIIYNSHKSSGFYSFDNNDFYIETLTSNNNLLGTIIVLDTKKTDNYVKMLCKKVSSFFTLEIIKEETIHETRIKNVGELFEELMDNDFDRSLIKRFQILDDKKNCYKYAMLAVVIDKFDVNNYNDFYNYKKKLQHVLYNVLTTHNSDILYLDKNNVFFILYMDYKELKEREIYSRIDKIFEKIRFSIELRKLDISISTSSGRIVEDIFDINETYQDLKLCIDYITSTKRINCDIKYDEIGIKKFFVKESREKLNRHVSDILGPIIKYDKENNSNLLHTLSVYLKLNRSIKTTSGKLNIHKNTLRYRINKIENILKKSLENEDWLQIEMAIEIKKYLEEIVTS